MPVLPASSTPVSSVSIHARFSNDRNGRSDFVQIECLPEDWFRENQCGDRWCRYQLLAFFSVAFATLVAFKYDGEL